MTLYEKFRQSSLDTGGIGLDTEPEEGGAVSALLPLGAEIIGAAPGTALRFCFVPGFGEAVFLVNASALDGQWVYPVASSFGEFLGLLLSCKGTEVLGKAWRWSRLRFQRFLEGQKRTIRQQSILRAIQNAYHPPEIPDPYGYLQSVRQGFDGMGLRFSETLTEQGLQFPGWKLPEVRLFSDFSGKGGKGEPGKAIPLDITRSWGGRSWRIPAAYLCQEGLVLDLCVQVPLEEAGDSPALHTGSFLTLSGRTIPEKRSHGLLWDPQEDNPWQALRLMTHFRCDQEQGWVFLRKSYRWPGKRPASLRELRLTLQAAPVEVPGARFPISRPGETVTIADPVAETVRTLTVLEYSQQVLEFDLLTEYPCQYRLMVYTLSPDLPEEAYVLRDCEKSAPLRPSTGAGAIGVIEEAAVGGEAGAEGRFPRVPASKRPAGAHTAASSLQYTQPATVTWEMHFKKKPCDDLLLDLPL